VGLGCLSECESLRVLVKKASLNTWQREGESRLVNDSTEVLRNVVAPRGNKGEGLECCREMTTEAKYPVKTEVDPEELRYTRVLVNEWPFDPVRLVLAELITR